MERYDRSEINHRQGAGNALTLPPFQDVPFDESEWRAFYDLIAHVHMPKAELMRARYEELRRAYQNYIQAREEAIRDYARQRENDLQYNLEVQAQRNEVLAQMNAIRERYRPLLEELFQKRQRATEEAYLALARLGVKPRIAWVSGKEEDSLLFEGDEVLFGNSEGSGQSAGGSGEGSSKGSGQSAGEKTPLSYSVGEETGMRVETADPWQLLRPPTFEEYLRQNAPNLLEEPAPPTEAQIAHEHNLPTFQERLLHPALLWLMTVGVGLGVGAVLWMAVGGALSADALGTLGFWLALLGGVSAMGLWVRGLWGTCAVVAELFHKFRWDERKSAREAWSVALGGGILLLFGTVLLMGMVFSGVGTTRLAQPTGATLLLVVAILVVPLWLVAMVEGFLKGRARAAQQHIEAQRNQLHRQLKAEHQTQRQLLYAEYQQLLSEWTHEEPKSWTRDEPKSPEPTQARSEALSPNLQRLRLIEEAREKVALCRSAHLEYQRTKRALEEELLLYQYELANLQLRPIYEFVSSAQYHHLVLLRQEWEMLYDRFIEQVAQAVEPLNDGESLKSQVLRFRRQNGAMARSEQGV